MKKVSGFEKHLNERLAKIVEGVAGGQDMSIAKLERRGFRVMNTLSFGDVVMVKRSGAMREQVQVDEDGFVNGMDVDEYLAGKRAQKGDTTEKVKDEANKGGEVMSRERMTGRVNRAEVFEAAVAALEKAIVAVDDAGLEAEADELAKAEKETVSKSVPAGAPELKDVGDQNAKANANWPLTAAEKQKVAARLVTLAKELLKS